MKSSGSLYRQILSEWGGLTMPSWSCSQSLVVMQRLEWIGDRTPTLAEAGAALGITRQSAHEMVQRFLDALAPPDERLHHLLRMTEKQTMALQPPIRVDRADSLLSEELGVGFIPVRNAASVAPYVGIELGIAVDGSYVVRRGESAPDVRDFKRRIGRQVRRDGFLSVQMLHEAPDLPVDLSSADARLEIQSLEDLELTHVGYFVSAGGQRPSRLVSNLNKMLAVSCPLHLSKVAGGLRRQMRTGRLPDVPSDEVLGVLLTKLGYLVVDGVVEPGSYPDPFKTLSPVETFLFKIMERHDQEVTQLAAAADEAKIGRRTLSHFLSYSPIVESRGQRRWGLRGRSVTTQSRPGNAAVSYSWNESGGLVLNVLVGSLGGLVVDIPASVETILNNRAFEARGGRISVSGGRFLVKPELYHDRSVGDWLPLIFDIASRRVEIG